MHVVFGTRTRCDGRGTRKVATKTALDQFPVPCWVSVTVPNCSRLFVLRVTKRRANEAYCVTVAATSGTRHTRAYLIHRSITVMRLVLRYSLHTLCLSDANACGHVTSLAVC